MKTLLVIGYTFPEPSTTAAGSRMMQLLELFQEEGYQITFASTATITDKSAPLQELGIRLENIKLNDSSFDDFVRILNPNIVVFDRFLTEEQFGWRVSDQCLKTLRILDTEDLHFIRKSREEAIRQNKSVSEANLFSDLSKRELASIFRSDLSLIISEYEMELLQNTFKVPNEILHYLPFLISDTEDREDIPDFSSRKNFVTLGNLLHAPNIDSVLQLKKIWKDIRKRLPEAELHIYGAYASQQIKELHNEKEGFLIKGWAEDLENTLKQYRVQLAPIRFGAGLKGKLVDAMRCGLPSVTTEIGAEGIAGNLPFGGIIVGEIEEMIDEAIALYTQEDLWEKSQKNGCQIIDKRFQKEPFSSKFLKKIQRLTSNLDVHRQHNFIGQMLQHHTMQSTKYLSKWIESKNSVKQNITSENYTNSDAVREEDT